jgi:hypothetical protein
VSLELSPIAFYEAQRYSSLLLHICLSLESKPPFDSFVKCMAEEEDKPVSFEFIFISFYVLMLKPKSIVISSPS